MKYVFLALIALSIMGNSSCKKCYTCSNPNTMKKINVCKGDYRYDVIRNGGSITDDSGTVALNCN